MPPPGEPSGADTRFVIISGLSGAGKSIALAALEDAGFYCVDNLPIDFLADFARHVTEAGDSAYRQVAVGIDARNRPDALPTLPAVLDRLREQGTPAELVFVDASEDVLLERFSETRRRHPLSDENTPLDAALARERRMLDAIIDDADIRIDTGDTNVHQLRGLVRELIARRPSSGLALQLRSFGFKRGVPPDADFVFDVRILPNPYWEPGLRDQTGRETAVREFLGSHAEVREYIDNACEFLDTWVPRFERANRSYLTVAFGCTGGRHRSVFVTESVAEHFAALGQRAVISHREL